jgi:hypothetical protein
MRLIDKPLHRELVFLNYTPTVILSILYPFSPSSSSPGEEFTLGFLDIMAKPTLDGDIRHVHILSKYSHTCRRLSPRNSLKLCSVLDIFDMLSMHISFESVEATVNATMLPCYHAGIRHHPVLWLLGQVRCMFSISTGKQKQKNAVVYFLLAPQQKERYNC